MTTIRSIKRLLSGLLAGIAYRSDTYEYTGAGDSRLHLWPGSALFALRPKWITAAEQVETNRRYCRVVARIDPKWIEPLAEHLVNRHYDEPHWDARAGSAMVFERVSLFGLPIVPRRRVPLSPVDPATARQLLIQHGLVEARPAPAVRFSGPQSAGAGRNRTARGQATPHRLDCRAADHLQFLRRTIARACVVTPGTSPSGSTRRRPLRPRCRCAAKTCWVMATSPTRQPSIRMRWRSTRSAFHCSTALRPERIRTA